MARVEIVDVALARWLTDLPRDPSDSGHKHRVGELLPAGYAAYIRLFHPFGPWDVPPQQRMPADRRTWRSLAAEANVAYHNEVTWRSVSPALPVTNGRRPFAVAEGDLDPLARQALIGVLEASTGVQPVFYCYGLSVMVGGNRPLLRAARLTVSSQ